jgi:hypothetical protein
MATPASVTQATLVVEPAAAAPIAFAPPVASMPAVQQAAPAEMAGGMWAPWQPRLPAEEAIYPDSPNAFTPAPARGR